MITLTTLGTLWSPQYLKQKIGPNNKLSGIYSNSRPVFGPLWRKNKPLGRSFPEILTNTRT